VLRTAELEPGTHRIVEIEGRSIGIYNVDGHFHAIRNQCPHQLAPLCEGHIRGTTLPGPVGEFDYGLEGQVVRCPWHGWEFDVKTGRSLFNPHRCRVKSYTVYREDSEGTPQPESINSEDPDPAVETFPVSVANSWVVVEV
jgi:3-phenylpropionate/trans-cinnamate dioxygenase ferredoxin subunit